MSQQLAMPIKLGSRETLIQKTLLVLFSPHLITSLMPIPSQSPTITQTSPTQSKNSPIAHISPTVAKMSTTTQISPATNIEVVSWDLPTYRAHYAQIIRKISGQRITSTSADYLHHMSCRFANRCEVHPALKYFASSARALEQSAAEACRRERNAHNINGLLSSNSSLTSLADRVVPQCTRTAEQSQKNRVEKQLLWKKMSLAKQLIFMRKDANKCEKKYGPISLLNRPRPKEVLGCGCSPLDPT